MQVSVSVGGVGLVGVAEELAACFAWIVDSKLVAAAQIFPVSRTDRAEAKGGGDEERDGREQLRDERLRSPEMFGPFSGGEKHFVRCRSVQVDSTKRRGHVLFNNETDAVSRS